MVAGIHFHICFPTSTCYGISPTGGAQGIFADLLSGERMLVESWLFLLHIQLPRDLIKRSVSVRLTCCGQLLHIYP